MGLLSNWVGLLSTGVGLFLGERVLKNTPTPLFEQPLKFIAHGRIFESLQYLWVNSLALLSVSTISTKGEKLAASQLFLFFFFKISLK